MAKQRIRPRPSELAQGLQLEGKGSGQQFTLGQPRTEGYSGGYATLWPVLDSQGQEVRAIGAATVVKYYILPVPELSLP